MFKKAGFIFELHIGMSKTVTSKTILPARN